MAGYNGLQLAFAALIAGATFCIALSTLQVTNSLFAGLAAGTLFVILNWQQIIIIRPQSIAVACYCGLFLLLNHPSANRRSWKFFAIIGGIFILWANCHGSFVVGIVLAGCFLLEQLLTSTDRKSQLALTVKTLALIGVAVVCNPRGWRLVPDVLVFADHPNLQNIVEWGPLTLRMSQGRLAAAATVALVSLVVIRRRIRISTGLLCLGFGIGMLAKSRLLVWWAPVMAMSLAENGHWFVRHRLARDPD